MGFCYHFGAILRKEWILWKRSIIRSIIELLIPFGLMIMLIVLRTAITGTSVPGGPSYEKDVVGISETKENPIMGDVYNLGQFYDMYFSPLYPNGTYALGIAPNTSDVAQAIQAHFVSHGVRMISFATESELIKYAANPTMKDPITKEYINLTTGVSFTSWGQNGLYEYNLLVDKDVIPGVSNNFLDPLQLTPLGSEWKGILLSAALYLKTVVDSHILRETTNNPSASITYGFAPMRYDKYNEDLFGTFTDFILGYFFLLSVLLPLITLIGKFMGDKVSRMRETMKIMGVNDSTYFFSYFTFYAILQFIASFGCTLIVKSTIFPHTNYFLLSMFFFIFGLSIFPFAIIVCSIFQKPLIAKIVGFMIFYFLSVAPVPLVRQYMATAQTKIMISSLPQTAFFLGLEVFFRAETANIGVSFGNLLSTYSYGYSAAYSYMFFFIDFVMYMIVALYLDNILPSPGGMKKSFLYFLQKNYWCPSPPPLLDQSDYKPIRDIEEKKEGYEGVGDDLLLQESQLKTVQIKNLKKEFSGGKVAVDGMGFDMYTGQIFALLGHNGAGKTTTISMLTGMLFPTSGSARAFGVSIFDDIMNIRCDLGVCTQHDSLFDQLTVEEHLKVFGKFKGLSDRQIRTDQKRLLKELKMENEKMTLAKNLSGGMKRKLSVAIAFLGNPRFVLLDEPTSGMDTTMRRELWDVLNGYKKNKVMLLTTHYMDEADALGDRIGIMVQGKMICCGTPMFLKKRYGIGYNLSLVKEDSTVSSQEIIDFVMQRITGTELANQAGDEIELRLPFSESPKFESLFQEIDNMNSKLGIKSYGISITTLEDVFIKVGEQGGEIHKDWKIDHKQEQSQDVYSLAEKSERNCCEQFKEILIKKAKESYRNLSTIMFSVVLPVLLILLGMLTQTIFFSTKSHIYSMKEDFPHTPVLVNSKLIEYNENSVLPEELMKDFSIQSGAQLSYYDNHNFTNTWTAIQEYAEEVNYLKKRKADSQYGGYLFYKADDKKMQYGIFSIFNLTCPQSSLAFTHEMGKYLIERKSNAKMSMGVKQMHVVNVIKDMVMNSQRVGQFTGLFALGLGLIPGLVGSYLVHEYEKELRAHLLLAGLPLGIYWGAYYLIDLINMFIPILLVMGLYNLLGLSLPYAWAYLLLFPSAQVSFVYVSNQIFSTESSVFAINAFVHAIVGMFMPSIVMILRIFQTTQFAGYFLCHLSSLIPTFSCLWGIYVVSNKTMFENIYNMQHPGEDLKLEMFDYNMGLQPLIFLAASGPVYFAALFICQFWGKNFMRSRARNVALPRYLHQYSKDEDVIKEEQRVQELTTSETAIYADRLSKVYPTKIPALPSFLAVHEVSFSVQNGEVFALLGVNGAGKTTTFKMITNDIPPNAGEIFICGENIGRSSSSKVSNVIGYCPQTNILFDNLTVDDHFHLYAAVKGIVAAYREGLIDEIMSNLGLNEYRKVLASKLSGGTKRKLSVGLAILGNPPIVLLDEPSTGIDPQARRQMWNLISRISKTWKKCAVVLTTHSMEEAEALSSRLAILVNGTFRCIGPAQYIKNKFAVGFSIEMKFAYPTNEALKNLLLEKAITDDLTTKITKEQLQQNLSLLSLSSFLNCIDPNTEYNDLYQVFIREGKADFGLCLRYALMEKYKSYVKEVVSSKCGETKIDYVTSGHYKFRVTECKVSIGKLFGLVEQIKKEIPVQDYSVMQTTLEEVFHQFAKLGEIENRNQFNFLLHQ